jgi:hypothetical protein
MRFQDWLNRTWQQDIDEWLAELAQIPTSEDPLAFFKAFIPVAVITLLTSLMVVLYVERLRIWRRDQWLGELGFAGWYFWTSILALCMAAPYTRPKTACSDAGAVACTILAVVMLDQFRRINRAQEDHDVLVLLND